MKKILLMLAAAVFPFMLFGGTLKVVCTTPEIADIVKNIGGDKVEVYWLMDGRQDPHSVEPRPSMVMKAKNADAVAVIGMDLDMWMDGVIRASKNNKIQKGADGYIDLSAEINKLEVPKGKIDGSMGDVHIYGNPHYHLDPANGILMAGTVLKKLSAISPADTDAFKLNYTVYADKLKEKIEEWKKRMSVFQGISVLPTHNCWLYFTEAFGMKSAGYLENKPGIAPSPKEMAVLSEKMKKEGTKIIFAEPFYPSAAMERLSQMTGAKIVRIPSSALGVKEADTYINLFEYNVTELEKALK
ncbi:MAG: zinc ABC transporter substrate-binding protein [Candidatus Goldbacteria bacterium]|nr:zinc ABC transporter substrate-binding protein [Candidatus Goldiibacteriota bacterium]